MLGNEEAVPARGSGCARSPDGTRTRDDLLEGRGSLRSQMDVALGAVTAAQNAACRGYAGGPGESHMGPGEIELQLQALDARALAPMVGAALRRAAAEPVEWRYQALRASLGPATGGLYRVAGTAREGGGGAAVAWSAVLKVVRRQCFDPQPRRAAARPVQHSGEGHT